MRTDFDLSDLALLDKKVQVRLKIENHLGSMVDYSAYFAGGTIDGDADRNAVQARFMLFRDPDITPYVAANELIKGFRDVTFEISATDLGDGDDWILLFAGKVDNEGWGGDDDLIVVPCTDLWGPIQRHYIAAATYGSDSSPVNIKDVMQALLNDNLGAPPTLVAVGDPNATLGGIVAYDQARALLGDALNAHANLIGWSLRYLWDETAKEFQLTFYEIDRGKTTPDFTVTPDDHFAIPEAYENYTGIRNRVSIKWADGTTIETVTVNDSASQTETGEVIEMELDATGDGQIRSTAIATALATAAVTDTAVPAITMAVRAALQPQVEIGDLVRFTPDGVHHGSNLDLGVTGYTHEFFAAGAGQPKTTLRVSGRPKAGHDRWFTVKRQLTQTKRVVGVAGSSSGIVFPPPLEPTVTITPVQDGSNLDLHISGNTSTLSIRWFAKKDSEPSEGELFGATPHDGQYALPSDADDVATGINEGQTVYIWAVGYRFIGGGGVPGPIAKTQWTRPVESAAEAGLSVLLTFNADGSANAHVNGNENTASWKVVGKVGSSPTDSEVRAASAQDGQSIESIDLGITATPGQEVFVGAFGYTEASAGGTEGPRLTDSKVFGVTEDGVGASAVTPAKLTEQARRWSYSTIQTAGRIILTATTNKYGWAAGTLNVQGTTYSISGQAATLTVSGRTWVYWDPDVSETAFQTTTTYSNVLGARKIEIALVVSSTGNFEPTVIERVGIFGASDTHLWASSGHVNLLQVNTVATTNIIAANVTTAKLANLSGGGLSIDFDATGNEPVLSHSAFELQADGDASFSGTVAASNFTATTATFTGTINTGKITVTSGAGNFLNSQVETEFSHANIRMTNLPTSDPAAAGRLWRSGNAVMVSTG